MRIAVSTETNACLDAPVAGHFGRCPFFTLIDLEAEQIQTVQVISNPFFPNHEPGQVPEFVHDQGARCHADGRHGWPGGCILRAVRHPTGHGRIGHGAPGAGSIPAWTSSRLGAVQRERGARPRSFKLTERSRYHAKGRSLQDRWGPAHAPAAAPAGVPAMTGLGTPTRRPGSAWGWAIARRRSRLAQHVLRDGAAGLGAGGSRPACPGG